MSERVAISKKLVLINTISSILTRILSLTVLVWLQQYLLNGRISPDEYELIPVLTAIMMFAPLITVVLTGGLGRFTTVAYAQGDDAEVTRICSTMFIILCGVGAAFLTLGWTFAWHIDSFLDIKPEQAGDARIMMAILMFTTAFRLPMAPFSVGFFVRQKFVWQNLIEVSCTLFRLALLFALLFGISTRVLWVITASASAELLNILVTSTISLRLVPALRVRLSQFHWPIARQITRFGGWQFAMLLGNSIRNALDPIMLNLYATSIHTTCYHVASLPFNHMWQFISIAKNTLNPALTAMHTNAETGRLQSAFLRGNRIALWVFLLPAIPLTLFSHQVIHLYILPEYQLTAVLIQINFFSQFVLIPSAMFAPLAEAMNKLKHFSLVVLATHLTNLGLTMLFVIYLEWGALGSCLATFCASVIFYPLLVWPLSRKTLNIRAGRWFKEVLIPGVLPGLLASPVLLAAALLFPTDSWLGLGCIVALGSTAYVLCLYAFAAKQQDRDDFTRVLNAVRQRVRGLSNGGSQ